ncbi:hypothetical protein PAEPH01_1941 [Pancytospora epiphaga]|nr:hypothetical protein PAEPH01_1941 [Pancytospora epiphaga]
MIERFLEKMKEESHLYEKDPVLSKLLRGNDRCIKCEYNKYLEEQEMECNLVFNKNKGKSSVGGENLPEDTKTIHPSCHPLIVQDLIVSNSTREEMTAPERTVFNRISSGNTIQRPAQRDITEHTLIGSTYYPKSKDYLYFLNFYNEYIQNRNIKNIDLAVCFRVLMCCNAKSVILRTFGTSLLKDSMKYSKEEKRKLHILFIFLYISHKHNGMDTRPYKEKIEEYEYLFKPSLDFALQWENDHFIDRFIMKLRHVTVDGSEALFLNRMYISKLVGKESFSIFHLRLCTALNILPEIYVFSFLQHVFTHTTVLFGCISELQLYKLIISYYRKESTNEKLADVLSILIKKVYDWKHCSVIQEQYNLLDLQTVKYKKDMILLKTWEFREISEYKEFFALNSKSYNAVYIGFTEISILYRKIRPCFGEYEVLEVLLCLFKEISTEFFTQLVCLYDQLLIEALNALDVKDSGFNKFNREYWCLISNVILSSQKVGVARRNDKKKKVSSRVYFSKATKMAHKLLEAVIRVEKRAIEAGFTDVITVKKRGFMVVQS